MVSSARLIPAQRCNWWEKRKDFAMCAALRKCGALCSPLLQNGKTTWSGSHITHTLM